MRSFNAMDFVMDTKLTDEVGEDPLFAKNDLIEYLRTLIHNTDPTSPYVLGYRDAVNIIIHELEK
jgi:hypothetical protein